MDFPKYSNSLMTSLLNARQKNM